jgi:hypothetical protein
MKPRANRNLAFVVGADVPRMLRSAISAFTRVFDALPARSRASSTRHQRVHARLRRATSAFTRVFDALWRRDALLIRGPPCECCDRSRLCGAARRALHRVRDTSDVLSPPCGDLPVGRLVDRGVESLLQKYFCFRTPQITSTTSAIPSHTEGRFAIVTDVGHGMRWTRQHFARDGIAGQVERLVSDHRHADERCCSRTAKSCGPDAPTLASSSRSCVGPTGLRQNLSADDGGKRARSPGRARHKLLKPLRAGMPGVLVYSLLLVCVLPIQSAHEAAGAAGTRHSPRPPWGREINARLGRIAPRGRERISGIGAMTLLAV